MRRRTTARREGPDGLAAGEASVTLRFACFDDAPDLLRLAQLDSAEPVSEPILVGEVSGRMVAALSLTEGRAIADPFVRSAGVVELLRARARQLDDADRRRWRRSRRARSGVRRWRGRLRPQAL